MSVHAAVAAIDFGTTRSAVAVASGDRNATLVTSGTDRDFPSAVARYGAAHQHVGAEAEALLGDRAHADAVLRCPKNAVRDRGTSGFHFPGDAGPQHIGVVVEWVLGHGLALAEQTLQDRPRALAVTHPAAWTPDSDPFKVLSGAAYQLGVGEPRLLSEPEAVAHHALAGDGLGLAPHAAVAIYDMGGGTTDVAVVQLVHGRLETLTRSDQTTNRRLIGGEVFDDLLYRHVLAERIDDSGARVLLRAESNPDASADLAPEWAACGRALRRSVRRAREVLSRRSQTSIELPAPLLEQSITLTREELERVINDPGDPIVDQTIDLLEDDVERSGQPVQAIILAGGASQTPLVRRLIGARPSLAKVRLVNADPRKGAVALGAARWLWRETSSPVRRKELWSPVAERVFAASAGGVFIDALVVTGELSEKRVVSYDARDGYQVFEHTSDDLDDFDFMFSSADYVLLTSWPGRTNWGAKVAVLRRTGSALERIATTDRVHDFVMVPDGVWLMVARGGADIGVVRTIYQSNLSAWFISDGSDQTSHDLGTIVTGDSAPAEPQVRAHANLAAGPTCSVSWQYPQTVSQEYEQLERKRMRARSGFMAQLENLVEAAATAAFLGVTYEPHHAVLTPPMVVKAFYKRRLSRSFRKLPSHVLENTPTGACLYREAAYEAGAGPIAEFVGEVRAWVARDDGDAHFALLGGESPRGVSLYAASSPERPLYSTPLDKDARADRLSVFDHRTGRIVLDGEHGEYVVVGPRGTSRLRAGRSDAEAVALHDDRLWVLETPESDFGTLGVRRLPDP